MRLLLFAVLSGLASGLLFDFDASYLPGLLFGLAIVLGAAGRFERLGWLRSALFIGASVAANFLAVHAAVALHDLHWVPEPAYGAIAGLLGAGLLGVALRLAFRVRALGLLLLAGAAAGAPFFAMPHAVLAYILWQGSVALVVARSWTRSSGA